MNIEDKLAEMGVTIPDPKPALGSYVPAVQTGNLVFVSGNLPIQADGSMLHSGKLGVDVSVEKGYAAARQCAINCLSAAKGIIGDLNTVQKVVKVRVLVNSDPDFTDQPAVANGASDLLVELFGESGKHARAAVGVASLPLGASVEVELVLEINLAGSL